MQQLREATEHHQVLQQLNQDQVQALQDEIIRRAEISNALTKQVRSTRHTQGARAARTLRVEQVGLWVGIV